MFRKIRRWFRRPEDPAGNIYYARLRTPQGKFYKVGYTTKPTLMERMSFAGLGDEKLVDREFLFAFRKDAWDIEQTLLEHFDKHRAFGKFSNDPIMPLAGRGQSELFTRDILGLDSDLYKLSDEDMAASKIEIAQANEGCLMALLGLALVPFTLGLSLLFIGGGLSGIFGQGRVHRPALNKPQHPPKIQALLDELIQVSCADKGSA